MHRLSQHSFAIAVVIGFVLGVTLGERMFPSLATTWGVALADIVLGIGFAFFAGLVHEVLAYLFARD